MWLLWRVLLDAILRVSRFKSIEEVLVLLQIREVCRRPPFEELGSESTVLQQIILIVLERRVLVH